MIAPQATRYLRLPFDFDLVALQQDLQRLQNPNWINHYNDRAHQKRWACLALYALEGDGNRIAAQSDGNFLATPALESCPYFQYVLEQFACEKTAVRLMSLAAGGKILPHRDAGGGFEDGVARLHIPIVTDPRVIFQIDGELIYFPAATTWYMNANCLHAVENNSPFERIHLVIDCVPNEWLTRIFLDAGWQYNTTPKYGDVNIDDENVTDVIANLRKNPSPAAWQLAEKLAKIQAGTALLSQESAAQ